MCEKMVKRDDRSLFLCKLCILRSQNPYLTRKLLDDLRETDAAKHAEDDAANNITGIKVVTGTIKKQVCDNGLNKKTEKYIIIDDVDKETLNPDTSNSNHTADNVIDEEDSDAELKRLEAILNAFTPERHQVRNPTKETKALKASVTLKQNLGKLNSSTAPDMPN